jgi:1,4-dihydroxy-2-naphthoyl-CoA hydrolase
MINTAISVAELNRWSENTLVDHLGIEFTDIGPEHLSGRMPVDRRTVQPFGILHGGASVALAESLGSMASALCIDLTKQTTVGVAINANHVRSVTTGYVTGTAKPVHIGRRSHVWEIRIVDDNEKLVCISRLTLMIVDR